MPDGWRRGSDRSWPSMRPSLCSQLTPFSSPSGLLPLSSPGMNERGKRLRRAPQGALPARHQRSFLPDTSPRARGRVPPDSGELFAWRVSGAESGPRRRRRLPLRTRIRRRRRAERRRSTACIRPADIRQNRRDSAKTGRHIERSSETAYGARHYSDLPAPGRPAVHRLSTTAPRDVHTQPPRSPPRPSALSTKSPTFATCSGL